MFFLWGQDLYKLVACPDNPPPLSLARLRQLVCTLLIRLVLTLIYCSQESGGLGKIVQDCIIMFFPQLPSQFGFDTKNNQTLFIFSTLCFT